MIRTGTFAYVKLHQIEAYHKAGWMIVDDMRGFHHGDYAVVMWKCDCEESACAQSLPSAESALKAQRAARESAVGRRPQRHPERPPKSRLQWLLLARQVAPSTCPFSPMVMGIAAIP